MVAREAINFQDGPSEHAVEGGLQQGLLED
jgi:hypothetical protein